MLKTRTVRTEDGQREVFAVDPQNPASSKEPLALESSILWLEPFEKLAYVREMVANNCKTASGQLTPKGSGRVVGYSKLHEDADADPATGRFTRRIFYLKNSDIDRASAKGKFPSGAIDPKSLAPGVRGQAPGAKPRPTPQSRVKPPSEDLDDQILDWLGDADPRSSSRGKSQDEIDTMLAHDMPNDTTLEGSATGGSGRYGELVSLDDGENFVLRKPKLSVGRMKECDIRFERSNISGLHCELLLEDGKWYVTDMNSSNGVAINGNRIEPQQPCVVESGAVLSIAKLQFELQYETGVTKAKNAVRQAVAPLLSKIHWPKKKD